MANPAWVKGVSGNPNGRGKLPPELVDCTPQELKKLIWSFWKKRQEDLLAFVKSPDSPAGELLIANVLLKGIESGDHMKLDYLLNRLIGKVKEVVEIEGTVKHELPTPQDAIRILSADYALLPPVDVKVEPLD